jgi:hypothetical protein
VEKEATTIFFLFRIDLMNSFFRLLREKRGGLKGEEKCLIYKEKKWEERVTPPPPPL